MKASIFRTSWIMIVSAFYTAFICGQSVIAKLIGKSSRAWVDKTMHGWAERILKLVKVDYKIINPHQVKPQPDKATIVMCNHSSLYDIPLSICAFPANSLRMLAKKELSRIPLMGKGMTAAEFPFIDRKNRKQAIADLEAVKQLLKSGIVMWIAPEGTRSKDGKLAPFKKGGFITAIETKATIIPIGIRGASDILPARTYQFNLNQRAEIHIGQPIDASQYTLDKKDNLATEVYHTMKQLVGEA